MASARHNIAFNLKDEKQKKAHYFLKKLGHLQSSMIAYLIDELLIQNGVKDVEQIGKEEAKELTLTKAGSGHDINKIMQKLDEIQNHAFQPIKERSRDAPEKEMTRNERKEVEVVTNEDDLEPGVNTDLLKGLDNFL